MQHKLYVEWETNSDSYVGSHATRSTQLYTLSSMTFETIKSSTRTQTFGSHSYARAFYKENSLKQPFKCATNFCFPKKLIPN